ncbi:UDP-glucose 4-epimerase [Paracoccus aminovorans]|uniref:UDP-glucose 4-epimerase n=1 Tax=Paracoccus aminovorans TaxID=34004 RepID=A0A1I2XSC1_9RHOB|nr:NAD-dependent epimerase/dehydratase family protein [Paracoccus aminovorans]CQR87271.1 NAD-dependent epimerase/dehydratase [Paracoccus aminovorans]SFH16265.1 UDP-glucose 4-epimerase [Paracoccus aminovorans]
MTRRTLVTGGAGFIGSHLVDRLVTAGEQVIVLDDLSSGNRENLPPEAELVIGDITDGAMVGELMNGADSVFHLAALVSVQECIKDWERGHRINLEATIGLFRAAAKARPGGVPVVYASSAAVYGDRSGTMCRESSVPAPISPYGADKLGCEHQARAMAEIHGLPSVGLRFFNVYGPRQDPRSPYAGVISRFCANRLTDAPHTVFGDGGQSRDFIYVADIIEGLIQARAHAETRGGASVFNLCTGIETTLLALAAEIDGVAGRDPSPILRADPRPGDIRMSLGDPSEAAHALGFSAGTDIRTGLGQLWTSLTGERER